MIRDLLTVAWKERRTIFRDRVSRVRIASILVSPACLAAYVAWDSPVVWLNSHLALLAAVLAPLLAVIVTVPDSFAGERERKTLQTLLASRLPDRAILIGKMINPAAVAIATWALIMLLTAALANLRGEWDGLAFYDLRMLSANAAVALLVTALAVGFGILVSLHSSSVQGALQMLVMSVLALPLLGGAFWLLLPQSVGRWFEDVDGDTSMYVAIGLMIALNAILHAVLGRRIARWRSSW